MVVVNAWADFANRIVFNETIKLIIHQVESNQLVVIICEILVKNIVILIIKIESESDFKLLFFFSNIKYKVRRIENIEYLHFT